MIVIQIDEILLDEKIKIGTEERYVKAWEDSRIEQNKMKIENKENELVKELKMLASDQKQDTRIHSEIESYILIQIARLEALIMDWTEKYNKELETRDNELIILNAEKENINSKLKNLVIKFHQQRETVEELSKFFEEIEREQEIHIKQVKAASRIQYWWRKYLHLKNEVAAKNRKSKSKKKK
ncbi:dynein regulatory complex protein 9-like [Lycorma delicatula]|uniref:dynein regulatory complex protein 9-like n=1 Tax=Lycorma delicatula TaxID=130591 RepID=UPI003F51718E